MIQSNLTAGQLVDLADRVRSLRQEVSDAGFPVVASSMNLIVATIEGEAGSRCVRELRASAHETEAA